MITESNFKPLWWLKNPHLQTLWPTLSNRSENRGTPERITLSDGDFLDIEWFDGSGNLVLLLHGLEGSIHSPYAVAATKALSAKGYHVVFMHFRGCSGEPNLLDRSYHSGHTSDLQEIIEHVKRKTGKPLEAAIGYSLGGNVLLKWLGEQGKQSFINQAIAVSVPFKLSDAAIRMSEGFSKLYEYRLLRDLRKSYKEKFSNHPSPLDVDVDQLNTFFKFDDKVTAALNGFEGAEDYYKQSSSRQYLKRIETRTLIIHSKDDPFMYPKTIPTEGELSSKVTLELTENGGHVGFVGGSLLPKRWLESRIIDFIQ